MKILMFGRGVIAVQYGWALQKAGHQVEFYVRPGKAAQYGSELAYKLLDARKKTKGVLIEEVRKLTLQEDISKENNYDLIILSVQHYQFAEAATFLAPKIGKATVLIFNNFWEDPIRLSDKFPTQQLAWGFPQSGGGFDSNGIMKGALFADVHFGTFDAAPNEREIAVRNLFRNAGFKPIEHIDLKGWLWIHFAIEAGLFSEVLKVGSVSEVIKSRRHIKNAILNVRELLPVVTARRIYLKNHKEDLSFYMQPAWLACFLFQMLTKISPPFKFFILSHNNPEEIKSYCRDVLKEARALNIKVPRLESIAYKVVD
ncbi:2-dehydropantoate 2-reductase [Pedobacter sp. UYP30]|uniref:ketopantoate reductase family protein n=1 Tax=Pedobacter sp. UYP30 TaxID=1756400 RepID=UPI003392E4DB